MIRMQRLLIFGAGSLAKIISQWLLESDKYSVAAFVVDDGYESDKCIAGNAIPVISYSEAKSNILLPISALLLLLVINRYVTALGLQSE